MNLSVALALVTALVTGAAPVVTTGATPGEPGTVRSGVVEPEPTVEDGYGPPGAASEGEGVDVEIEEVQVVLAAEGDRAAAEAASVLVDPETAETVTTDDTVVADTEAEGRVLSPLVETDGFQTLGITWAPESGETPSDIQVRTRGTQGWTEWVELAVDDAAPDLGTPDAEHVRPGTEALWVGQSDAVQLSFAAESVVGPEDMKLALLGSDEAGAAGLAGGAVVEQTLYTGSSELRALVTSSAPRIVTRAQWGAAAQVCRPSVAQRLVGAVVHHTAGSNSYATVAQAMQQIRNDQRYHIQTRGWCDLGYNFVVDKWGNIYEGRAESLSKPVVGVHAGGFNTGTLGVSMLGTYDAAPSWATQQAVAQIIGFRLGSYGLNAEGWFSYHTLGGENSKVPAGTTVSLPRVFGHRDVAYTACPGNGGYGALPNIRRTAAQVSESARIRSNRAVVTAMYQDLLGRGPDEHGLADWTWQLTTGGTAADVGAAITRTEEYNRRKIAEAYRTVLGRRTDEPGVLSWLDAINRGVVNIDEIANHLVVSEEFYLRSGRSDAGLVSAMYTSVLGRAGSPDEIHYWTTRVASLGRGGVIRQIMGSREAAQRKVQLNYRHFLNRLPDIPGMNHWTDIHLARGEAVVRANILGSEEYRLRSLNRFG